MVGNDDSNMSKGLRLYIIPLHLVCWTLPWLPTFLSYEVEVGFASFFGNFPGVAFVLGPNGLGQLGWFP